VGQANLVKAVVANGRASSPFGDVPAPGMPDGPCELLVRPESVEIVADPSGAGRVVDVEFYGHDQLIRCRLAGGEELSVRLIGPHPDLVAGTAVALALRDLPRALSR
jgi:hypothetical protein